MAINTAKKGAKYERKTRKMLELCGWLVCRSAASKGPFDLIALISPGWVKLIQVKVNKILSPGESERLSMYAKEFPGFSVEVWKWVDRCKEPDIEKF